MSIVRVEEAYIDASEDQEPDGSYLYLESGNSKCKDIYIRVDIDTLFDYLALAMEEQVSIDLTPKPEPVKLPHSKNPKSRIRIVSNVEPKDRS